MATTTRVLAAEKVISILSYITFGIVGFIWLIISSITKKKIKYFLSYHIYQSIFIAILLTLCHYLFQLICIIFSKIPVLDVVAGVLNYILTVKIISFLGIENTVVNLAITIVGIYIIIGVTIGKSFFLPFITPTIEYYMEKNYN